MILRIAKTGFCLSLITLPWMVAVGAHGWPMLLPGGWFLFCAAVIIVAAVKGDRW